MRPQDEEIPSVLTARARWFFTVWGVIEQLMAQFLKTSLFAFSRCELPLTQIAPCVCLRFWPFPIHSTVQLYNQCKPFQIHAKRSTKKSKRLHNVLGSFR